MSMIGSFACLSYFVFGKNDSVGILGNIFPSAVAAYNLYLEIAHRRRLPTPASPTSPWSEPVPRVSEPT